MGWLIVAYIVTFILWLTGAITISGWWFIVLPLLFIPAMIVLSILFTMGAFATVFSFFGLAILGDKLADKLDERKFKSGTKKNGKV